LSATYSVKPLRIAFNHTRLDSSGGVEGYIANLLRYLLDRGHSVDFFTGKVRFELKHPGLRIFRVPYIRAPRPARVASFALLSHRCIAREEKKRPYDIVQGFSRTYYHTLYRDGSGCRRDYCELYLNRLARSGLRRLYYSMNPIDRLVRTIERIRYVKRPQVMVIAISSLVREQILRRYHVAPETVRVVYSGVDCDRFHPDLRETGRRTVTGLFPESDPGQRSRYVAFVGNDYRRKGLDLVLEALAFRFKEPRQGEPALYLFVAGRDSRASSYERQAAALGLADRVRFLGSRSDIPELLAGSDALLFPTYFDAYGNIANEALASGIPVITSSTAGAAELIRPEHGWVLEENDARHLSSALEEFCKIEDLAPTRQAAREAALALSWDRHYGELEKIYQELAARRSE